MPTYEYACKACGHRWEEIHKMTDPPVEVCEKCHAHEAQRLISQGNFILKGGGWYTTGGYGVPAKKGSDDAPTAAPATSAASDAKGSAPTADAASSAGAKDDSKKSGDGGSSPASPPPTTGGSPGTGSGGASSSSTKAA